MNAPLLELCGVGKRFRVGTGFLGSRRRELLAVDRVSLAVQEGEVLGLVGESGSGKSTLGRLALMLLKPDQGRVLFAGREISGLSRRELRPLRQAMQIVFQDPFTSLNPRLTVGETLAEPFAIAGRRREAREAVPELLRQVGLSPEHAARYPHQFSAASASGWASRPWSSTRLVVADEPVSAWTLHPGPGAQPPGDLRAAFGLSYLLAAHTSRWCASGDRVAVMYLGQWGVAPASVSATGPAILLLALRDSAPVADPHRSFAPPALRGDPPSPLAPPPGCRFHPRCPEARPECGQAEPLLRETAPGRLCACHFR